MSPQAYEYLIVAANLAHFHAKSKWGFSIKKRKWDLFIKGHQFSSRHCMGTFEIDLNSFINGVSPVHSVRRIYLDWHNQCNFSTTEKLRYRKIVTVE